MVETGDSGLAFKCTTRYKRRTECENDVPHTIVGQTEDGTVVCSGKGLVDKGTDSVDLGPLAVDPDYQGKGYGTKLMDFAESLAPIQQVGVVSCRSDVMPIYKGMIHWVRFTFLKKV